MTEEEALIRAREAAAQTVDTYRKNPSLVEALRRGSLDADTFVQTAKRALLDLDKPLPVDRDEQDIRELLAAFENETSSTVRTSFQWRDPDNLSAGHDARKIREAFRAIIQRRIEEAGK